VVGRISEGGTTSTGFLLLGLGLAQTTAAAPVPAAVLDRAIDVILAGSSTR
jgi:hypothetical protein